MSRIGNSLDNRGVEYFFGCLKGEYLNHIPTNKMGIEEIEKHIVWYIEWYNTKILHWKTPASTSTYAIKSVEFIYPTLTDKFAIFDT